MLLQSSDKQEVDQYIKLFITDIEGNKVEFSTLPIYEKMGELTTAAYELVSSCNEQIEDDSGYIVNLEMLDAIEGLAFMMNIIMNDVDSLRGNINNLKGYTHE